MVISPVQVAVVVVQLVIPLQLLHVVVLVDYMALVAVTVDS